MTSKLSQRAQKLFIQYLRENNLKVTQERLALLDEIFSTSEHLDADELLARMKVKQRKVSRATVYRNPRSARSASQSRRRTQMSFMR